MMKTQMTRKKIALMTAFGVGLLALPFAMPSTAQADDFRISLNLGGGAPYYHPVAYRPAPQYVNYYRPAPQRVVYVSRPVYRERVVYNRGWNNGWRGHERDRGNDQGHGQANNHGGWNNQDHRTAWR